MSKKRIYQSVDVGEINAAMLMTLLAAASVVGGVDTLGCIVALDVAKTGFFAGVADIRGQLVKIIRFQHPKQTGLFLRLMQELQVLGARLQLAMEPTGTYGDAIREQLHHDGFEVYMVSPKYTHDMAEIQDGVPSSHDGKSTAIIAKLHAMGKSRRFEPDPDSTRQMRATADRLMMYQNLREPLYGRLEALLAKFWPEFYEWIDVRQQRSWMGLLEQLAGPEAVAHESDRALELLKKFSRGSLPEDKRKGLVASAMTSIGVKMNAAERTLLSELVAEIQRQTHACDQVEKELAELVKHDPVSQRIAKVVGVALAAALICYVGDPNEYSSAAAYVKACGLNLKIRSSGKHVGQLKITKRGNSEVRRLAFLAAGRLIQSDHVTRCWYQQRKSYQAKLKMKAMIAVMRKLVSALWHVGRGAEFDSTKLFDTRRLHLENDASSASPRRFAKRNPAGVRTHNVAQHRQLSVPEVQPI